MLLQGHSVFSSLVPPAEGPRRGRQRFTRGRAAAVGTPALVAWTLPLGATRWPELHSASLRDPGNSLFVRPPSGIPEGKQHLHLSVSTCPFIYVQATGRGAGSHNPGSGATAAPPLPSASGKQVQGELYASASLLHSFHRHSSSLQGAPRYVGRPSEECWGANRPSETSQPCSGGGYSARVLGWKARLPPGRREGGAYGNSSSFGGFTRGREAAESADGRLLGKFLKTQGL